MKQLLSAILIFCSVSMYAQHVGINKPIPTQPLDVNGNLNVDGNILVNATAGEAGQVLTTTSTGATAWANLGNYTYVSGFTQNGTFTVPAGITRILVEAWGAGGGGSSGGGGAAGMYILSVQDVTAGQALLITLGVGGSNATTFPGAASNGTITTIAGASPFLNIQAAGGLGAFGSGPGYATRYGTGTSKYIQYPGENGEANAVNYEQKNATTFTINTKYGDGGAAGPDYTRKCQGQTFITNENTGVNISTNSPTFAPYPGGGGGGGTLGRAGADGMVIIRY